MNIFILDSDPKKCAEMHCDKHVVKMIVESAQMLSTAHRMLDGELEKRPSKSGKRQVKYYKLSDPREDLLYRAAHINHPCTVWTRESSANYKWHYHLFSCLCDEYNHRYNKVHRTDKLLRMVLSQLPINIPREPLTPFALAMNNQPQCIDDKNPIMSYKKFYKTKQSSFDMKWTKREIPDWLSCV